MTTTLWGALALDGSGRVASVKTQADGWLDASTGREPEHTGLRYVMHTSLSWPFRPLCCHRQPSLPNKSTSAPRPGRCARPLPLTWARSASLITASVSAQRRSGSEESSMTWGRGAVRPGEAGAQTLTTAARGFMGVAQAARQGGPVVARACAAGKAGRLGCRSAMMRTSSQCRSTHLRLGIQAGQHLRRTGRSEPR
jgi:hypothetical protein